LVESANVAAKRGDGSGNENDSPEALASDSTSAATADSTLLTPAASAETSAAAAETSAASAEASCSSRGRIFGTWKVQELMRSRCGLNRCHYQLRRQQLTMLSFASSNIAMISFGCAQMSVRGMPLDLHRRH
jgi:hypothetical protein